ncbi:magnesium transporter [Mycoplasma iguanae]|uniref:Magnesium transporter MgtE n=1 Tax=Mycoplasma iguanae TaxID=292461 RepID=A0ABY5RC81_9MOLU|nr:magnesium transporter [Mycoplasma iguanae]UVD81820.1 magnesium transporter [Mycoplasma iguanae]
MTLKVAIQNKDVNFIRDYSKTNPIASIAAEVENLDPQESVIFFRLLSTDISGEVFSFLSPEVKQNLIKNFSDKMIASVLEELYTDEIADILEEVPSNLAKRILKNTDKETRNNVNKILKYSDDVVGSIMSIDIVNIKDQWSCSQALKKIRDMRDEAELVHYYYVVDQHKHLIGAVTLEDLVFSDPKTKVKKILFPVPFVRTYDKKEEAAHVFADNDLSVIPVINSSRRIVGMLTSDDIIDIFQEEATEDMYKMAGISSSNIDDDYLKTAIIKLVKSRVIWLIILMIGSTLSQIIIDQFTNLLEHSAYLNKIGVSTFFSTIVSIIPVIAGSAGNAGSQAATTITRAISLGEIEGDNIVRKVLFKEFMVGLIIGSILMTINFARLMIYFSATKELFNTTIIPNSSLKQFEGILIISFAASLAMLFVIIFSKFLGSIIPLIASKIGKDPAVMSAPILATLTDATSTLIFFGIAISIFLTIPL